MAIKPKYGYYPANFDLEQFCLKYKLPAYKVTSILHLFIVKPVGQEEERWITLNATLLRKRVGDVYKKILDALFDFDVIDIDHAYEKGEHSKAFILLDKYQYAEGFKKHSIESTKLNVALIAKNKKKAHLNYLEDLKLPKFERTSDLPDSIFNSRYRMLIHWFQDGKLTIDIDKAYSIIERRKLKEQEPYKYLSYLVAVDMLHDKDYNLKSDSNQRFYSAITNLPKVLRSCLLYDGEELAGVDVSNTQPLLLSELCNPIYLSLLKEYNNIDVDEILFDEFIEHLSTYPEDLKQYKNLVESGNLYESFVGITPDFTRAVVKENMVKIINDRGYNNTTKKKILREALKSKFPTISTLLNLLKSKNHKYTSSTLMSLEAQNFVIHFPEIFSYKAAHKNIPIFTIHDCFMTTKSKIEYLESEIKLFFRNKLSIEIPLKREKYT
jgi:hypothetical protein